MQTILWVLVIIIMILSNIGIHLGPSTRRTDNFRGDIEIDSRKMDAAPQNMIILNCRTKTTLDNIKYDILIYKWHGEIERQHHEEIKTYLNDPEMKLINKQIRKYIHKTCRQVIRLDIEMGKKHITMTKIKKEVSRQKLRKLHQKNDIREMYWNICFARNNFCSYLSEMSKQFGWCTEN